MKLEQITLEQLTNEVNEVFYNDTSSYKTIASIQQDLLSVLPSSIKINKITNKHILIYFEHLKKQGLKDSTINNKMMYLSKILNYALKTGRIQKKLFIPHVKNKNKKTVTITPEQYKRMIDFARENNKQELYLILVIGYNTGMRISNILALHPEDINNNYIRVWRNKTNTPYSIPLNDTLKQALEGFKGFNINYRQAQYQFSTMIKDLQLDSHITIHTLRHTTCTTLIERGIPLPVVQQVMNHKNIQTTMLYTHIKSEQLEKAVSVL